MKTLLPEAGALERATTYRDKKIKPLFTQMKNKIAAMAAQVKELAEEVEKWCIRKSKEKKHRNFRAGNRKYYITFRQALDKRSSHKCFG